MSTTIKTTTISNFNNKKCLECSKIPNEITKKTRTITKQSNGSTACCSNTYYYCIECVPDNLPESKSIAIAGEVILLEDWKRLMLSE
jgi:hypothetical protein